MLVISDRFTKLTQVVPLKHITAYDVAVAFLEHWVFKYGAPATLLSDNRSQFVFALLQTSVQHTTGAQNLHHNIPSANKRTGGEVQPHPGHAEILC